ncbi:hypothetical protein WH158_16625 [Gluconobacter cerinus]
MNEPVRAAPILLLLFLPMALIFPGRVPGQKEHHKTHGKHEQTSPDGMQKALPDQKKDGELDTQRTDADNCLS